MPFHRAGGASPLVSRTEVPPLAAVARAVTPRAHVSYHTSNRLSRVRDTRNDAKSGSDLAASDIGGANGKRLDVGWVRVAAAGYARRGNAFSNGRRAPGGHRRGPRRGPRRGATRHRGACGPLGHQSARVSRAREALRASVGFRSMARSTLDKNRARIEVASPGGWRGSRPPPPGVRRDGSGAVGAGRRAGTAVALADRSSYAVTGLSGARRVGRGSCGSATADGVRGGRRFSSRGVPALDRDRSGPRQRYVTSGVRRVDGLAARAWPGRDRRRTATRRPGRAWSTGRSDIGALTGEVYARPRATRRRGVGARAAAGRVGCPARQWG